ncbi:putative nucleic acid-binding Zn-ribbon protein [Virgibacillus natechei]|uniref:Nucleic acid-binding Zn-ribbon protein n=1 Tax=Virgibacillus natechei TaxID=1216297 RepID=A0ABS4IKU0_9BACI|nr:phage scaffolding protein [Virgibacillus natechei]MBP1971587.1 putative nucleic acid-binding Zn-ribbon protein [Virgibacillus natechei]UZD13080.1 phage scaffolding protein [Virgibacillus natechei]
MPLKDLLGEELYNQVIEKAGDEKVAVVSDGSYLPKEKFDEKNQEAKDYKKQVEERDEQISNLSEKAKGSEDLTKQIDDLKEQNKKQSEDYESQIKQQAFDHTLKDELTAAKVKNPKAVKALLDTDTIKLDGEKLLGLEEQLKGIQESDPYMFEEEESNEPPKPSFSTGQHNKGGGGEPASLQEALSQHFSQK